MKIRRPRISGLAVTQLNIKQTPRKSAVPLSPNLVPVIVIKRREKARTLACAPENQQMLWSVTANSPQSNLQIYKSWWVSYYTIHYLTLLPAISLKCQVPLKWRNTSNFKRSYAKESLNLFCPHRLQKKSKDNLLLPISWHLEILWNLVEFFNAASQNSLQQTINQCENIWFLQRSGHCFAVLCLGIWETFKLNGHSQNDNQRLNKACTN